MSLSPHSRLQWRFRDKGLLHGAANYVGTIPYRLAQNDDLLYLIYDRPNTLAVNGHIPATLMKLLGGQVSLMLENTGYRA